MRLGSFHLPKTFINVTGNGPSVSFGSSLILILRRLGRSVVFRVVVVGGWVVVGGRVGLGLRTGVFDVFLVSCTRLGG